MRRWLVSQKGTTLVEVLVAGTILTMVAGALLATFRSATLSDMRAQRLDQAAFVAQGLLEDRRHSLGAIPSSDSGPVPDDPDYAYSLQVQFFAERSDLAQVAVQVWAAADPSARVEFTTVVRVSP